MMRIRASTMNNHAVLSLVEDKKDYDSAVKSLTKTLREIKHQMSSPPPAMVMEDEKSTSSPLSTRLFFLHSLAGGLHTFALPAKRKPRFASAGAESTSRWWCEEDSSVLDDDSIPSIGSTNSFFFKAPILLCTHNQDPNPSDGRIMESDTEDYELVCFAVMYNLALTYHLRGTSTTSTTMPPHQEQEEGNHYVQQRNRSLRTAATLYIHAHQVLLVHQQDATRCRRNRGAEFVLGGGDEEVSTILLHEMAIASNLGHIYSTLGDVDQSRLYFEHLLSIILYYVVDCGGGGGGGGENANGMTIASGMLDGFVHNVLPLIFGRFQTAAAA